MPPVTRIFIRAALVYLVAALLAGALLVTLPWLPTRPWWWAALTPAYFHLFMVGWVTQLIFGVAYWMFPKFTRTRPRGWDRLAWSSFVLLNGGLILRLVAEPVSVTSTGGGWGALLAAGAVAQWLGGLAFVVNTWPRVKEK